MPQRQLFHEAHDATVSTTFRGCCVLVKISEHRAGTPAPVSVELSGYGPDPVAVELLECSGFTTERPTCASCVPDAPSDLAASADQ